MNLKALCACALLVPGLAPAAVYEFTDGVNFDTDVSLFVLKDGDATGLLSFDDALAWADQLVIGGLGDWRLPKINERSWVWSPSAYTNLQDDYWLAAGGGALPGGGAVYFTPSEAYTAGTFNYAIAVHDLPVVSPAPEPSTYALMLAGLALVGWAAQRRQGT